MKVKEKKRIRFRVYLVATFFLLGLGAVTSRAYQLQIIEKDRLVSIARAGYIGTTKLPPKRGAIYDRDGHELALSVEVGSIYAHPKRIKEKIKTARHLSRILAERQDKILELLRSDRSFVWIKRKIASDRAKRLKTLDLDGIGVINETKRYYPGREIAGHLIGFVGTDSKGLEGLEKKYDRFLRGSQYNLIHMRDALGRPFSISRPVLSGHKAHDIILTIDKDIQYKAQQVLEAAVRKTKAKSGHCLVLDPMTGEILAMAVVPDFNPNVFTRYSPDQWRNRIVTDCFEPGSTLKAFLLATCLDEYVITPNTNFDCENGKYRIGKNTVHDTHKHGVLSVTDIIVHSSNIGAIKIGQVLGYKTFYEYLKKFGFANKTGIGLLGERKGFIRGIKQAKPIDQANLFFGQGMTTTSLQMAVAMAAIANGGNLMRPYVVKAILNKSGDIVHETRPKVVRSVISCQTARKVVGILEGVVSKVGTGPEAAISGFRVAGKTGTSQKVDPKSKRYSRSKYVATFAGFVPANQPRLVIMVVIDEPKGIPYGGMVAAPVFREVGLWALNHLQVNPQIRLVEKGTNAHEKVRDSSDTAPAERVSFKVKAGFLPDFRGLGMRKVIREARSLGLKLLLEGTGMAVKQHPKPGAPLRETRTLKVVFKPPA